ncbi:hypothetical protein BD311DRAFT_771448 [Dichomitus squalens]|uniref:Uncharacterized protein n=1 Tax=Dichomitus squalens TaxID=114155 RepID=A0A4Q9M4K7_9APHY|nr:hypothetical protein BD311DRAFT_771448 [Dichomitus squalens]
MSKNSYWMVYVWRAYCMQCHCYQCPRRPYKSPRPAKVDNGGLMYSNPLLANFGVTVLGTRGIAAGTVSHIC